MLITGIPFWIYNIGLIEYITESKKLTGVTIFYRKFRKEEEKRGREEEKRN